MDAFLPAQPAILRLTEDASAATYQALCADPGIVRHDSYRAQLGDLLRTRQPDRTLRGEALERAIDAALAGRKAEREGVWVHYPWSRRLVHLLDEAAFVELRTSRNRYKITGAEQEALAGKRVGVVGLSVGQSVAGTMAQERCAGELRLADFDHIDLSNLNRLRAGVHDIGVPKVVVTARQIAEIDPFLAVRCFDEGLTEDNLDAFLLYGGRLDLVVDECDDLAMKFALRFRARELGIPVVMDTSDRGLLDIERFDREPGRPLFHGLVEPIEPRRLRGLTDEEKVPLVADIIGRDSMSSRAAASLLEVGQTIRTWPQLGSAVALGGGVACDAVRRILLGEMTASGRYYVDVESIVADANGAYREAVVRQHAWPRPAAQPVEAASAAPLADLIRAAGRAPSGGNCQPWRFLAEADRIWVVHDQSRSASFLDYEDTAAMAALGAATENLVLAAHAAGLPATVTPTPADAPRQPCVARIDLAGENGESHAYDELHAAIGDRHTNRRLGARQPLASETAQALEAATASVPGCRLQLLVEEEPLAAIGGVLGNGDRVRFLNEQLHGEMFAEVRWTPEEARRKGDGIDVETLELSGADRVGLEICRSWKAMKVLQRFGGGFALARASRKAVAAASAVGLVTVDGVGPHHFFAGGRAMQRMWLTATVHGLAVQPLSSLPYLFARLVRGDGAGMPAGQREELEALRGRYADLFELSPTTGEVLLVRFAHAEPARARALRRPLDDVFEILDAEGERE